MSENRAHVTDTEAQEKLILGVICAQYRKESDAAEILSTL